MSFGPRTFRCPSCNEMINDSMKECRYCSWAVDPGVAQVIADKQQAANQAVSDASYLRTAAISMYVFLALSVIPFLPVVSTGFLIVFVVVVVLLIRWQVRFGSLNITDPDFQAARRSWTTSLILMIVAAPLAFIVRPLLQVFLFYGFSGE